MCAHFAALPQCLLAICLQELYEAGLYADGHLHTYGGGLLRFLQLVIGYLLYRRAIGSRQVTQEVS